MSNLSFPQIERLCKMVNKPFRLKNWYFESFTEQFYMDFHSHPQIEIMYCESGAFDFTYKFEAKSASSQSITVNSNSFILVNNGYYHKIENVHPATKIINLEFEPFIPTAEEYNLKDVRALLITPALLYYSCPRLKKLITCDDDFYLFTDNNNVQFTMREVVKRANEEDSSYKVLTITLLTSKLFADISQCPTPEKHLRTGVVYVDVAMKYINTHLSEKISIEYLTKATKVSKVYLQKLFKKTYGKTVHQVILEKRIDLAKYLLRQSNLSIRDIALRCGFGCREQFSVIFKKQLGISPFAFRKEDSSNKNTRHFSHIGEITIPKNTEE